MAKRDMIVGLDIGTTKVCAVVAEFDRDGMPEIAGFGQAPSTGIRRGLVVDMENTVAAIRKAVDDAELMAGFQINSVCVGISGAHINGWQNRSKVVNVKGHEVAPVDIARAVESASEVQVAAEEHRLHVLPRDYILDGKGGIRNPAGIAGNRLEVEVYIITAQTNAYKNIVQCVTKAGLQVSDVILQSLAASEIVLTDEEKELGVVMADIGGGTIDISMFAKSHLCSCTVLPMGGEYITSDIANGLRTPFKEAERIKKELGCRRTPDHNRLVDVPLVGSDTFRSFPCKLLWDIVEARTEEMLSLIWEQIELTENRRLMTSGVVLTGGTALLPGIVEAAERMFKIPVRVGRPTAVTGKLGEILNDPAYAAPLGLINYGSKKRDNQKFNKRSKVMGAFENIGDWFKDYF